MAHLFIDDVYDSFNRQSLKISTIYYFPDFSFFMSQDDTHYQNYQNAPNVEGGYNSLNSMNIVKSVNCKQAVCSYISDGIFIIIYFYSHRS